MRVLYILENPGFGPGHRDKLLTQLRSLLPVINVRVGTRHIEVDVITENIAEALEKLEKAVGGKVVEVVDISFENVGGGLEAYVQLFNKERFWEAHMALEEEWKRSRDSTLQGLIMLAAAFVKIQEGRVDKFETLLKEALNLLKDDVGCLKIEAVRKAAEKALITREFFRLECL
ncbi:MAG: DUF309 domain-containing protein [Pyrobaculum sp.]